MCERERESKHIATPPLSHKNKKVRANELDRFNKTIIVLLLQRRKRYIPSWSSKVLISPPPLHPIPSTSPPLLSSPLNLIAFKNLHHLTSSTNRLLSTINLSLQHTSRTNRLLCAVNFSLKHASGSNGLFGAVDHFAELELLGEGVV